MIAAASAASAFISVQSTKAATGTWIGGSSGDWSDAGNWDPAAASAPGGVGTTNNVDTAKFNAAGNTTTAITIDAGRNIKYIAFDTANVDSYTIGSAGANGGNALVLTSAGNISLSSTVADGTVETFNAPLTLAGSFRISNFSTGTARYVFAGDITNTNASTLTIIATGGTGVNVFSGNISNGGGTMSVNIGEFSSGSGKGFVEFTGANTYSGTTFIDFAQSQPFGVGQLTLSGTNSSNGQTNISHGTLILNNVNNGGLATGTLSIGASAYLGATSGEAGNITNAISLINSGTVAGNNTITFNGDYTVNINSRSLTNSIVGGNLTMNGNVNISSASAGGCSTTFTGAGNTYLEGVVQDYSGGVSTIGGNITYSSTSGGGVYLSNNANSYTGTSSINGLTVALVSHAFGDSNIVLQGAGNLSLRSDATGFTINKLSGGNYTINTSASGATINVDAAADAGANVTKTFTLNDIGTTSTAAAYTLNFSGANNSSLSVGTITGSASTAAGTDTIANAITGGGSLTVAGYQSGNKNGNGTLVFNGVGDTTVTGDINQSNTTLSLSKLGTGTTTLNGGGNATGTVTLTAGTLVLGIAGAISTGNLALSGGTLTTVNDRILTNVVNLTASSTIDSGGNLTFSGLYTQTGATGTTLTVNNNTTLTGGINISNASAARTDTFSGNGTITVNSAITNGASSAGSLIYKGTGTMNLNGANTYSGGTSVISNGTLGLGGGGSLANTAVTIGSGTGGSATAVVSGDYTIGISGVGGSLTLAGGAGGAGTAQGTLSMVDGTINVLTLQGATGGTLFTIGSTTAGLGSILNFETGNSTVDSIVLNNAGRMTLNSGGATINLTALGVLANGTYDLITYASTSTLTGTFTLGTAAPAGKAYYLNSTTTAEQLLVLDIDASDAIYWKGTNGSAWNILSPSTNFTTDAAGTTPSTSLPGANSNVYFSADGATNLATTLGSDFTINSLNYNSSTGVGSIGGGNTLTINAANGYTDPVTSTVYAAGTGLVMQSGAGNQTITSKVFLGGNQTWTVADSNQSLTFTTGGVSGVGFRLTKDGNGTLSLNSTSTLGGLSIKAGAVILNNNPISVSASTILLGDTSGSSDASLQIYSNLSDDINVMAGSSGTAFIQDVFNSANYSGNLSLGKDVHIAMTRSANRNFTISGVITGNSTISASSTNNSNATGVIFTGDNSATFTGNIAITGGRIGFATNGLGTGGTISFDTSSPFTNSTPGLAWAAGNTQDVSSRFAPTAGSFIIDTGANDVTFGTGISGSGKLLKDGSGTLILSVANTFTGGVSAALTGSNAGNIAVGNDAALGTGTFTMSQMGIRSADSTAHTLNNVFAFAGSGPYQFGDADGVANGSLTFGNTTATSLGGANRNLTVYNTTTFDAAFTGTGASALTKTGGGTLILNGDNAVTGAASMTVSAGRLIINGSSSGNIAVSSGATLGGAGTVLGTVATADNTAVISPGVSPGDLTVSELNATAGARFKSELGSTDDVGVSDHLIITGTFAAPTSGTGGLVLDIAPWGFDPAGPKTGVTYSLITFGSQTDLEDTDFTTLVSSGLVLDTTFGASDNGGTGNNNVFVGSGSVSIQFSSVPEPTSLSIVGVGLGGMFARRRRRIASKVC